MKFEKKKTKCLVKNLYHNHTSSSIIGIRREFGGRENEKETTETIRSNLKGTGASRDSIVNLTHPLR